MADLTVNSELSLNANMRFAGYLTLKAGEDLFKGNFVSIDLNGELIKGNETMKTLGIVTRDASKGSPATVFGSGTHVVNFSSGMTAGGTIYMSNDVAGAVTQTKPATVIEAGIALNGTDIMVLI